MLPGKYRLKKRSSFARVELSGKMSQFPLFGLGVLDREDKEPSKFGFVISTKISKKAVDRNKIKRIISEEVRLNYKNTKVGYDVVFLAKPAILRKEEEYIRKEVVKALRNASIL